MLLCSKFHTVKFKSLFFTNACIILGKNRFECLNSLKSVNIAHVRNLCCVREINKPENLDITSQNSVNQMADYYDYHAHELGLLLRKDMLVFPNFINQEEETSLFTEIEPYLKKLKYEHDHWDKAIEGYRETEKKQWFQNNKQIIQRVIKKAFPPDVIMLPHVHVLDLEKSGCIKAHIDSVRFCGSIIAGVSLLSDSVMQLVSENNKDIWANVFLPQRSLYVMKNAIRYDFSHAILGPQESVFKGLPVQKGRRISIICRCQPSSDNSS